MLISCAASQGAHAPLKEPALCRIDQRHIVDLMQYAQVPAGQDDDHDLAANEPQKGLIRLFAQDLDRTQASDHEEVRDDHRDLTNGAEQWRNPRRKGSSYRRPIQNLFWIIWHFHICSCIRA